MESLGELETTLQMKIHLYQKLNLNKDITYIAQDNHIGTLNKDKQQEGNVTNFCFLLCLTTNCIDIY